MWGRRTLGTNALLGLGLAALAVGLPQPILKEEEVQAFSTWVEIQAREHRAEDTSQLLVTNSAPLAFRLANCVESHALPAGGNISLQLKGLVMYWVLPQDLAWDCRTGPFDFFYIDANLTGPRPSISAGYGLVFNQSEMIEAPPPDAEGRVEAQGDDGGDDNPGEIGIELVGLELAAAGTASAAEVAEDGLVARCGEGVCGEGREIQGMPSIFNLAILGPQSSGLGRRLGWGRGRRGGFGRRWGYGRRWGWRRGRWGRGRGGWRRGGWWR